MMIPLTQKKKVFADAPIGKSPIAKRRYIRNLDPI